jgi:glyoxylase-like metal-dependent hydrolase (beta-lactamase superfamily II)
MKTQELGGVTIDRIVDLEALPFPLATVLPTASRDAVEAAIDLLPPGMIDPGSLALRLSFHSYLIRTKHHRILVDMCFGNNKERPYLAEAHHHEGDFLEQLAALGASPDEIDYVLCTHLHADHVGWNTRLIDGRWVPTFPRARYIMSAKEYDHWNAEHAAADEEALKISAFADSVLPIVAAGRAVLIDGEYGIGDAIRLEPLPGHSPGHQIIHVTGNTAAGLMTGDTVHHAVQLLYPHWDAGYCNDPARATAQRRHVLERYADTPTVIFAAHFPPPTAGRIKRAGDAFRFEFID